jgi:hypothetical protein
VDTLQKFLPSTEIMIHNGKDDALPLIFAWLAMADQSFTSLSSFDFIPMIGGFGDGHFQQGNRGVNPFNKYLPGLYPEKLHMNFFYSEDGPWKMKRNHNEEDDNNHHTK